MIGALLLVVCMTEFAVMATLGGLMRTLSWWTLALIDMVMLTLLLSLFMWLVFIGPLRQALDREKRNAQLVLDHAAEGIVTIDERGAIRSFNRAAERMFGYAAPAAIGQNIRLIVPGPDKERHDAYLRRHFAGDRSQVLKARRRVLAQRRDGSVFPVEMSMSEAVADGQTLTTAILLDITERQRLEEQIRRLAHYDELTGIPNRTLYFDHLERALAFAHREQHKVGLLFLDLDGFKQINDELGHHAGDQLLRLVAARLSSQVRESDRVARLGGDEFTVILPGIQDRAAAEEAAQRIALPFDRPFELASGAVTLGVSRRHRPVPRRRAQRKGIDPGRRPADVRLEGQAQGDAARRRRGTRRTALIVTALRPAAARPGNPPTAPGTGPIA